MAVPYLIDEIMPAWSVHLLGGISDAGKTRWSLPAFVDWSRGLPVLGQASHPVPWVYVAADRPLHEAEEAVAGLGLTPTDVPIIPAFGRHNKSWVQVRNAVIEAQAQLAVIEGFGDFVEHPGHRFQVREFLSELSAFLPPSKELPDGLTILGVMESPKLKPNEYYRDVRQRISGVASWGYHSSTIFLIETVKPDYDTSNPKRMMHIRPKGRRGKNIMGMFDANGCLRFP